ncbi:MAG: sodium:calcium antiporter [Methylocystaceae bacterium]
MNDIAMLLISLIIILAGAEVFTNGVEWLGIKLNLSHGAVGSLLAAVGTALPETMIPIIAIFLGGSHATGHEIGIGAILGAPLMLSTLAMLVTGVGVLAFARRRKNGFEVSADPMVMRRDLSYFLLFYTSAILAGIFLTPAPLAKWRILLAVFLVVGYLAYAWETLNHQGEDCSDEDCRPLYLTPKEPSPDTTMVVVQVLIALSLIVFGAREFVGSVEDLAGRFGVPAFVLALIIAPIATELPEKFNSVIWVRQGKDTLALGNITGAMVFQGSIITAIGLAFTPWQLNLGGLVSGIITILASGFLYIVISYRRKISATMLIGAGMLYIVFIIAVLQGVIR